jgi:hypothetical protein
MKSGHHVLEGLLIGTSVAFERELDVLGSHRLAVVEARTLAKHELVDESVG